MKASPQVVQVPQSLEEQISAQGDLLQGELSRQSSPEEIEADVRKLQELVNDLSQQDRRLEKLLDLTTPSAEVRRIFEELPEAAQRVVDNHRDLERLHSVSHQLIERSARLITKGQRLIDQSNNKRSRYALEVCGLCDGFGRVGDSACPACNGNRSILVHQPAMLCPRCKGTGKPDGSDTSVKCYGLCTVCLGSGWALRLSERKPQQ